MIVTAYESIYLFLKEKGYDVYTPGTKKGECNNEYIVVKKGGSVRYEQTTSEMSYYLLLLYEPKESYSKLENFVENVKKDMQELHPRIRTCNEENESVYDDNVKGHLVTLLYKNYKHKGGI